MGANRQSSPLLHPVGPLMARQAPPQIAPPVGQTQAPIASQVPVEVVPLSIVHGEPVRMAHRMVPPTHGETLGFIQSLKQDSFGTSFAHP